MTLDTSIDFRDLPPDDQAEVRSGLLARIVEDIVTCIIVDALMSSEEETDLDAQIEKFFANHDLKAITKLEARNALIHLATGEAPHEA